MLRDLRHLRYSAGLLEDDLRRTRGAESWRLQVDEDFYLHASRDDEQAVVGLGREVDDDAWPHEKCHKTSWRGRYLERVTRRWAEAWPRSLPNGASDGRYVPYTRRTCYSFALALGLARVPTIRRKSESLASRRGISMLSICSCRLGARDAPAAL